MLASKHEEENRRAEKGIRRRAVAATQDFPNTYEGHKD
jgi:hypothetical protein